MIHRSAPLAGLLLLAPLTSSCSSKATTVHLDVTVGQETDAFSQEPKVVSVAVKGIAPDGSTLVTATAAPGGTLDFGEVPIDTQLTFEATGLDAAGNTVARGRSVGAIPVGAVNGTLPVFVQRVNQWARPPGALAQTHEGGIAAVGAERYLVLGGGTSTKSDQVEVYDLFALGGTSLGDIASQPETMLPRDSALFLASHKGGTSIDLGTGNATTVTYPTGTASFADVAGGQPVDASDGRTLVVGGTRSTGEPTKEVLVVASDGTLKSLQLTQPRLGASAVWVEGVGLVVIGGSETAPGVEVLGPTATTFAALDFPADATVGAGAAIDGVKGVVLIGGTAADAVAPVRRIDPTCVAGCMPTVVSGSDPSVGLTSVHAYALGGERFFVTGEEIGTTKQTRTFSLQLGTSATELPLREPRRGAAVIPAPTGCLAILGGAHLDGTPALSVELFFPQ